MSDNPYINTYDFSTSAPKYNRDKEPMPSDEELCARNSFGSPDDNPYILTQRQKDIAAATQQLARLKGTK